MFAWQTSLKSVSIRITKQVQFRPLLNIFKSLTNSLSPFTSPAISQRLPQLIMQSEFLANIFVQGPGPSPHEFWRDQTNYRGSQHWSSLLSLQFVPVGYLGGRAPILWAYRSTGSVLWFCIMIFLILISKKCSLSKYYLCQRDDCRCLGAK